MEGACAGRIKARFEPFRVLGWGSFCRRSGQASNRSDFGGRLGYVGNYEMTPSDRQFRAALVTRKPEIAGFQSALVIKGDGGGPEIDVDKLGRILVQFYWDRKKKQSRRVRVAQFWAGSNRGSLFVPRIGDEVLVEYEEGDPDRPIVVGSVYNGTNTVPMNLPGQKNNSGILTKSTKNSQGYNFLLFNDTAGSEVVKLRAQKDLMFKALNNEQRDIVSSQTENVGQDETINVGFPVPPPRHRPRQRQLHLERAQQGHNQRRPARVAADAIDHGHAKHHAERRPGRRDEPDHHEPDEHNDAVDGDHDNRQRDRERDRADG